MDDAKSGSGDGGEVRAKSIDPAAQQMLAVAESCGISTAFSRADAMKPCPIGRIGRLLRHLLHGPLPLRRQGRRRAGGHLRRRLPHHRRPQLRPRGRRRRGRPLRPRPRHGLHPAGGSQRRGRRLPIRDERSSTRWPATWASTSRAAPVNEIARDVADKALERVRPAARRAHLPESAPRRSARQSGAKPGSPRAASTARSSR